MRRILLFVLTNVAVLALLALVSKIFGIDAWMAASGYGGLGPLLVFFAVYSRFDVFVGTAAFMVATAIAMGMSWALTRHIAAMTWFSAVLVGVFGGGTAAFAGVALTMLLIALGLFLLGPRPQLRPRFA